MPFKMISNQSYQSIDVRPSIYIPRFDPRLISFLLLRLLPHPRRWGVVWVQVWVGVRHLVIDPSYFRSVTFNPQTLSSSSLPRSPARALLPPPHPSAPLPIFVRLSSLGPLHFPPTLSCPPGPRLSVWFTNVLPPVTSALDLIPRLSSTSLVGRQTYLSLSSRAVIVDTMAQMSNSWSWWRARLLAHPPAITSQEKITRLETIWERWRTRWGPGWTPWLNRAPRLVLDIWQDWVGWAPVWFQVLHLHPLPSPILRSLSGLDRLDSIIMVSGWCSEWVRLGGGSGRLRYWPSNKMVSGLLCVVFGNR